MNRRRLVIVGAFAVAAAIPHLLFILQPYFADESTILLNAIRFLSEKTLVPYHVSYPTFYSYLALPFIAAGLPFSVFGDASQLQIHLTRLYVLQPLDMVIPARVLSLCLLAVSALVAYRTLAPRKGRIAGAASASVLLLSPALLDYGSYALPDAGVLAFSLISFERLLHFIERFPAEGAIRNLLWASAAAGLAVACKYNAVSAVIPIAAAVATLQVQRRLQPGQARRLLNIAALCCVLAFLAGSPGWLLAPQHLAGGLVYEIRHAAAGHLGSSGVPFVGQLEILATKAPAICLAGIAGAVVWWRSRTAEGWIAVAAILGSLALSALSSKQSLHYLYPGFAGWLYFTGAFVAAATAVAPRPALAALVAIAVALYGQSLYRSAGYLSPNTTLLAEDWIYGNIPAGERIAVDWAYVPYLYSSARLGDIRNVFGPAAEPVIGEILRSKKVYEVVEVQYDAPWLADTDARYLVTSDQALARFFCTGLFTARAPASDQPLRQDYERRKRFYEALFRTEDWRLSRTFETGNGPRTYLFAKNETPSEAGVAMQSQKGASLPGCG